MMLSVRADEPVMRGRLKRPRRRKPHDISDVIAVAYDTPYGRKYLNRIIDPALSTEEAVREIEEVAHEYLP